jgi:D-alanine--poly(phosphoribitol) ligase subunit 2
MAEFKEQVLDILEAVSLLVEFQERLDIEVSISDFDRDEWATPNMIIKKLEEIR